MVHGKEDKMNRKLTKKLEEAGFKSITQMTREEYKPFEDDIECSDLTLTNLLAYDANYHYMVKRISDCLVITGINVNHQLACTLIPLNKEEAGEVLTEVNGLFHSMDLPLTLDLMCEKYKVLFENHPLVEEISYNPDYSDYVYSIAEYIDLEGGKNSKKRRHMNHVEKNVPGCRFEVIDNFEEKKPVIMDIMNSWCENHECSECVYGCEKKIIEHLLDTNTSKQLYGGLLYIEDEPEMFAIGEIIQDTYYLYFKKSKNSIDGTFFYFEYYLLKEISDVTYVNFEEDMGLAGLRTYKSRRHPIRMIDKYVIKLKENAKALLVSEDEKSMQCEFYAERKVI